MTKPLWEAGQSRQEYSKALRDYKAPKKAKKAEKVQVDDIDTPLIEEYAPHQD